MNGTTQGSTKWVPYYQETSAKPMVSSAVVHSNATSMTSNTTSDTMFNHYNPCCRVDSELNPKGNIGKPIRRRFRASRKTPVTLLNANIANFRALVQQYTGFQSANPFFTMHKGPINLNFAEVREDNDFSTTSTVSMLVNNYHGHKVQAQRQHYQEERQQSSEYCQEMFSIGTNNQINAVKPTSRDVSPDTLTIDDFVIGNTCLTW